MTRNMSGGDGSALEWFKSSYSSNDGPSCVEIARDRSATLDWFKSSYSSNDGPECVEVAAARRTVHVRDSKDLAGPQLGFTSAAWADFVPYASGAETGS